MEEITGRRQGKSFARRERQEGGDKRRDSRKSKVLPRLRSQSVLGGAEWGHRPRGGGGLYIQVAEKKTPVLQGVRVSVCVCVCAGLRSQPSILLSY